MPGLSNYEWKDRLITEYQLRKAQFRARRCKNVVLLIILFSLLLFSLATTRLTTPKVLAAALFVAILPWIVTRSSTLPQLNFAAAGFVFATAVVALIMSYFTLKALH